MYNKMPFSIKKGFSHVGRVIPPRYIYGRNFTYALNRIRKTEYWSKRDLNNLRSVELRRILLHAYRATEYYRKEMSDKRITEHSIITSPEEVLKSLDFTDERLITEKADEFLSSKKYLVPNDYS